jgi:26S proteasome subunit RPN7
MAEAPEKKDSKKKADADDGTTAPPYPDMSLAQKIHCMMSVTAESQVVTELAKSVFNQIATELENPTLYRLVKQALVDKASVKDENAMLELVSLDTIPFLSEDELLAMEAKHLAAFQDLHRAVATAQENAGDMECFQATQAIARFATQHLSYQAAIYAQEQILVLPKVSSGKRIDALQECTRIASFYHFHFPSTNSVPAVPVPPEAPKEDDETTPAVPTSLEPPVVAPQPAVALDQYLAKIALILKQDTVGGGDWDRRNRYKVYQAMIQLVSLQRDIPAAATVLLQAIPTFTCTELASYAEFVTMTIVTNMLHQERPIIKKEILQGPEIRAMAHEIPVVVRMALGLVVCANRLAVSSLVAF